MNSQSTKPMKVFVNDSENTHFPKINSYKLRQDKFDDYIWNDKHSTSGVTVSYGLFGSMRTSFTIQLLN